MCHAVDKGASGGDQPKVPAVSLRGLAYCTTSCAAAGQPNLGADQSAPAAVPSLLDLLLSLQVHLILRHKSPKGVIEEKHLEAPPSIMTDKDMHVYTAIMRPDNT